MAENLQSSRGRPGSYRIDRGGFPTETGPFIGEVMNNHDPARIGRVQVYIPEFGVDDKSDQTSWRTVRYLSPFFGNTQQSGTSQGQGQYVGNSHSYGMWFTVPDVGVKVLCFFVAGDQSQGYYVGSIPDPDLMHMVPATGASSNFEFNNPEEQRRYAGAARLPVTEINNQNTEIREDSRSFAQTRPVHSYTAAVMYQQGLIKDSVRGPIGSSAYRESPSATFGINTPGRPIYESGASEYNIQQSLRSGAMTPDDVKVVGRRSGHSFVMDDGDLTGNDNLVRIRTGKGHQILLSDDGNCIHIIHANGQSWVELGKEGTVDVYAANSINLRSQGDVNIHADQNLNLFAGQALNLHSKKATILNSEGVVSLLGEKSVNMYSTKAISVKSDGTLGLAGTTATSLSATGPTAVNGAFVLLNTGPSLPSAPPVYAARTKLPDTKHSDSGWTSGEGLLDSIVTRAPTHEPYVHHNKGVPTNVQYDGGGEVPPSDNVVNKLNEVSSIGVRPE